MHGGISDTGRDGAEQAVPTEARPFVALALACVVGVALGRWVAWGELWLLVVGLLLGGMLVMLWCGRRTAALRWGLLVTVGLMAAWQVWQAERVPADHIARYVTAEPQLAEIVGVMVDEPYVAEGDRGVFAAFGYRPLRTHGVVAVESIMVGEARVPESASGRLLFQVRQDEHRLRRGQRVRAVGWLSEIAGPSNAGEFDYAQLMRDRGIAGRFSVGGRSHWERLDEPTVWRPGTAWHAMRQQVSGSLQASLRLGMDEDGRSLALMETLLLGLWGRELAETYEAFRRVGLAHLMSISGAHLAILLGLVWGLVRLLVPHPRWAAVVVLVVLGLYMLALPLRVPVVRAAIMAGVFCAGFASGRRMPGMGLWGMAMVAVLVWRPGDLFTPGFQLSFGIVAGLLLFTRRVSGWLWPRDLAGEAAFGSVQPGPRGMIFARYWSDYGSANLVAFVLALPVVAYHFQLVSPLAMVVSLLALPAVVLLLGLGYLKMVLGLALPSVSEVLAWPLTMVSELLLGLVDHAQHWPGAVVMLARPPSVAWVVAAGAVGVALLAGGYVRRRAALTASVGVLLLWAAAVEGDWAQRLGPAAHQPVVTIHSFSVGAGTAHLIQAEGRAWLFDCGSHTYPQMGARTVVPGLQRLGVRRLETVFISHAHLDHFNGPLDVADRVVIGQVLVPPAMLAEATSQPARPAGLLLAELHERGIPVRAAYRGWSDQFGETRLSLLWPTPELETERVNDTSLVLAIDRAGRRLLMTGDIQAQAIAGLLEVEPRLRADVLEMPHHGEFSSAVVRLIETVEPEVLIQSNDWRRLENDRWPAQLEAMGRGEAVRLSTADRGMIGIRLYPDGRIETSTYLRPTAGDATVQVTADER